MSLIQEALKRQQMELEGKLPTSATPERPASTPASSPSTPPVIPAPETAPAPKPTLQRSPRPEQPPPPEPRRITPTAPVTETRRITPTAPETETPESKKNRVLPTLALVLLVLVLLAGAAGWALMYGLELAGIHLPWSKTEPAAEPPPAIAAAAATATAGQAALADSGKSTPAKPPATQESTPPPAGTTPGSKIRTTVRNANDAAQQTDTAITSTAAPDGTVSTVEPDASVVTTPPAKIETVQPAVVATSEPVQPAVAESTVKPAAASTLATPVWPELIVSGIVGKELRGAAIINGKVVGVNETIQDVRVIAIKPQGALLEYKGETRLIKIGLPVKQGKR